MLVIDKFEQTVEKHGDKIALVDGVRSVTFSELRKEALDLAAAIHEKTGAESKPILVAVNRRIETVVAYLAVLYSGNFYVPVSDEEAAGRMEQIAEKLEAEAGIFHEKNCFESLNLTAISSKAKATGAVDANRLRDGIIDADPCYVLFTSGSTGAPKGVVVAQKMVVDFMDWIPKALGIDASFNIANQTPLYFDASVKELALMMGEGATVHLMDKKLFLFPVKAVEYLNEHKISAILWSVSAMNLLANSKVFDAAVPKHLKVVAFAGEAFSAEKLKVWRDAVSADYFNLYGPTETTVDCAYYKVDRDFGPGEVIPIGRACENMDLMILDGDVPAEKGELVVRGTGVAYGYYNDPEKTKAAFVQNPLNSRYPEIVYRTGDIVRRNGRGEIEFLAREDDQIKRHGYRIELGEVERALFAFGIKDGMCFYDREKERIVAVYTGEEFSRMDFRKGLKAHLPAYMIPDRFIHVAALPTTRNGKIDRKALEEAYEHGAL